MESQFVVVTATLFAKQHATLREYLPLERTGQGQPPVRVHQGLRDQRCSTSQTNMIRSARQLLRRLPKQANEPL